MSTKISQLTSATDVTANDLIQIVDVEDGVMAPSGTNKKATASLLANQLVPLISSGAIAGSKIADSGITSAKIADGTIVNADINAAAAIAGTKISPSFGSQDIITTGSLSAGIGSVIAGSGTEDALRVTQTGTGNSLLIEESTNPDSTPFLIDASGNVISGYTTSVVNAGSVTAPRIQVHGLGGGASTSSITSWTTGVATGPTLLLSRADSGTIGSHTIVDAEDQLGKLSYAGSDGTQFIEAAMISAHSDGTPSAGDMPGRLMFSTTADGASTVTERMRINSSGAVGIGTASPSSRLHIQDDVGDGLTNTGLVVSSFQPRIILNDRSSGEGYVDIRNFSAGGAPQLIIGYGSNTDFGVRTGERLRIDSTGRVGIGVNTPSYQLQLSTDSAAKPSTSTWTISSDERLKEDIELANLDMCYDAVKSIPLKRYKWKDEIYSEEQVTDRSKIGWIAQDVKAVFPKAVGEHKFVYNQVKDEEGNIVSEDSIDDCLSLNSDQLYAALFGAVQKLIITVESLQDKVVQLESGS